MAEQAGTTKRKRGRSPSYPGIDLKEALLRSHALYQRERGHAAPIETILNHWGYKPGSGPGLVALAALKKFGLLIDEGTGKSRKARLSDSAIKIALDTRPETGARYKALQNAALSPTIHRELWNKYGDALPSDLNLRYELVTERSFTEAGADEFIPQYRRTLAFAHLLDGGKLSVDDEDKDAKGDDFMTPPATLTKPPPASPPLPGEPTKRETRVYQIPLPGDESAALQVTYPLTARGWTQLENMLKVMKVGIVEGNGEAEPGDKDEEANE